LSEQRLENYSVYQTGHVGVRFASAQQQKSPSYSPRFL